MRAFPLALPTCLLLALAAAGCSARGRPARATRPTTGSDSGSPSARDAGTVPSPSACPGGCAPGLACADGRCVPDCRAPFAMPCGEGLLCNDESGLCVAPGDDCTLPGAFVPCGTREFAPRCGPGSRCATEVCVADTGCEDVVCDSAGACRGVRCTSAGATGSVSGVVLESVEGGAEGVRARARVSGRDMCRVSVTFEAREETSIFTSASNDEAVWEVDLRTGAKTRFVEGIPLVYGLAVDRTGSLYVLRGDNCQVGRIEGSPGARRFVGLAEPMDDCARLTIGPDGALYAANGRNVMRIDLYTHEVSRYGDIPDRIAAWGDTFITGLAFHEDGTLFVAEHWRKVLGIAPGGGTGVVHAEAPPMSFAVLDNPWNEGIAVGPDGLVYVTVFPENPVGGFLFRIPEPGSAEVLLDLAAMTTAVPSTRYAGIHAVAFGIDGAMYLTNQNTRGNTYEPLGQLFVLRTDGVLELLADGFNFDWIYGYDGDMTVGTRAIDSVTAPVDADGTAEATLDVPPTHGAYEVRVFVTDPETGRVHVDSRTVR